MDPSFLRYGFQFLAGIVNGAPPPAPRDPNLEEQVIALMTDYYRQLFGPTKDPCFMIVDNAQSIGHKRVYQAPFGRQRYGELNQYHMTQGVSGKLHMFNLLQLRMGLRAEITWGCYVYNCFGTVDKIRSRLVAFGLSSSGSIVRIDHLTSVSSGKKRYYGFFHEILDTKSPDECGMMPHPSLTPFLLKTQRAEIKKFINKFLGTCCTEMGCTFENGFVTNCFLSSVPSMTLYDKDDFASFAHPPPFLEKSESCRRLILSNLKSQNWFMLPGKHRFVTKCLSYPYELDFHGKVLPSEPNFGLDGLFLIAQCLRPKFCVCLFCGEGEAGGFETDKIHERLTARELLGLSPLLLKYLRTIGTKALENHVKKCAHKPNVNVENRRKQCYSCWQWFYDTNTWYRHCKDRVCVVRFLDGLFSKRKRPRKPPSVATPRQRKRQKAEILEDDCRN